MVNGFSGESKVLSADLDWVEINDIQVGSEILAFYEGKSPHLPYRSKEGVWLGQGANRDVKLTKVVDKYNVKCDGVIVTFSNGDKITTTKNTFIIGKTSEKGVLTWFKSKDLIKRHSHITKYMNVWERDMSYESGWLAGFMDGEGSLCFSYSKTLSGIQACQNPTVVWDRALELLSKFKIKHSSPATKSDSGSQQYCEFIYSNGKWDTLEFIGKLDICRFKDTIRKRPDCYGTLTSFGRPLLKVSNIETVENFDFTVIETESKTMFCDGFGFHNSNGSKLLGV